MKTGIELMAEERQRHVRVEGYDAVHDDTHVDGSLADFASLIASTDVPDDGPRAAIALPWQYDRAEYIKRKYADDRIRQLVIAGAVCAAEIDRLQRKS